jgi:DNA polymerase
MNKKDQIAKIYNELESKLNLTQIFVPGEGNPDADLMLVGEAPGAKETELRRPFVGAAGKNLDEFLSVIKKDRAEIYISNIVKFRPYKVHPTRGTKSNRPPKTGEIKLCLPYLLREIEVIAPKIIVTLGNTALKSVLGDKSITIGSCHGTLIPYSESTEVFALYHPASIIYNRSLKEVYSADLSHLCELLIDN